MNHEQRDGVVNGLELLRWGILALLIVGGMTLFFVTSRTRPLAEPSAVEAP